MSSGFFVNFAFSVGFDLAFSLSLCWFTPTVALLGHQVSSLFFN